jgi:hypothetical protein
MNTAFSAKKLLSKSGSQTGRRVIDWYGQNQKINSAWNDERVQGPRATVRGDLVDQERECEPTKKPRGKRCLPRYR